MAGRSTSEEMEAPSFDELTPPRPVSIFDLDEEIPTRMQSSEEIAEYQRKTREQRDPTHRSFRKASEPASPPSGRPIPRESGPVLVERPRSSRAAPPPAEPELDLDEVLSDVAATISKLPPAPRVPSFDRPANGPRPEPVRHANAEITLPVPAVTPRSRAPLAWAAALLTLTLGAIAMFVLTR